MVGGSIPSGRASFPLLPPDRKQQHHAGVVPGRALHEDKAIPDRHLHPHTLQEIGADRREGTRRAGIARWRRGDHFRRSDLERHIGLTLVSARENLELEPDVREAAAHDRDLVTAEDGGRVTIGCVDASSV